MEKTSKNLNTEPNENQKDVTSAPKKWSTKTIGLVVLLAVVLLGLTYVALYSQKKATPNTNSAEVKNPADTSILIGNSQKENATTYSSLVSVDTGSNKINAIQLVLSYDPKVLTKVDVVPLTFIPNVVVLYKKIDPIKGRIYLTLATALDNEGISGKGDLAKITYSPVSTSETTTSISFLSDTRVTGLSESSSLLKSTIDGSVDFANSPSVSITSTP